MDTGVTVVAGNWDPVVIRVNAAGTSAAFLIDGVTVATLTTNLPTAAGREFAWGVAAVKSVGVTSVSMFDLDVIEVAVDFTAARF